MLAGWTALGLGLGASGAGCSSDTTGTVSVSLATAPGSHVLDAAQTLRLTLTEPRQVTEAQRSGSGFDLSLEVDANAATGALIVEGLDAAGALVACGQSPAFPVAAINATVTVYMAAPRSVALSPAALAAPRSELSGAALSYGAVLAGGRDAGGAPTADLAIYNAYVHSLIAGVPLPAARTGVAMTADNALVLLFGGTGPDGNPTGTLWRYDTSVAPSGSVSTIVERPEFARTGEHMLTVPSVGYPITGTPALTFDGTTLAARTDVPGLPTVGGGGSVTQSAAFVGDSIIRLRQTGADTIGSGGRASAGAAVRADGKLVVVGGGDPLSLDALVVDLVAGTVSVVPGVLQTGRLRPAVAVTSRHVVVVGGTDAGGAPIASAEILDATTLAPLAVVPIAPRSGTYAVALPTDQVLIAGGSPASTDLELFTPEPPAL